MNELRTITACEARAYLDGKWRIKLNEIYDGIRAMLEVGADNYVFQLDINTPITNEIVLKRLELDGYRLVTSKSSSLEYCTIFW